ncbi:uncharacterized protein LOC132201356 [Neocloeon triangulifer]|uniref:uncharacterized protein LOC132201356 n=1 Tax=Neocloeon triangulifer TaxID=2078957 RepID=UPI00286F8B7E|nr:uncharacterized protein LOC132201356 [Neocloeon triangulifer]XP_059483451.1 uncharacterized protein LOC132201356 [Neocloeon triangulifer]
MAQSRLVLSISVLFLIGYVAAQGRSNRLPQVECYENRTLYERSLRIPTTMTSFISLIDKIERIPGINQDLRTLSSTLLHRFRTDGVERDPLITSPVDGVVPFLPSGFQNGKHRLLLEKLIPGNALNFPNASLTNEERCGLHFMMSHTVDRWERRDESQTCNRLQNYRSMSRIPRSVHDHHHHHHDHKEAEEKEEEVKETLDYDEVPQDHDSGADDDGRAARQQSIPESACPIEEGALWTPWGAVSGGALIAGIAAGLQRQEVSVNQLQLTFPSNQDSPRAFAAAGPVDNVFAATLSGDLAEVVLRQGPRSQLTPMKVGSTGGWNDTAVPRYYFLNDNENYEMTDAEIRGALDGLILGLSLPTLQSSFGSVLKLSQVLDMYYSERGIPTQRSYRACQRREQLSNVAPSETIQTQVRNIIPALGNYLVSAPIRDEILETYIATAVSRLNAYVPGMNDRQCEIRDNQQPQITADRTAAPLLDLFLVIDPTWMYEDAMPTLAALLREVAPHPQASTLTLTIGSNEQMPMINYTRTLLDFYGNFTYEKYQNYRGSALDVVKSLAQFRNVFFNMREEERMANRAGGRSQVLLFIVNTASGATDENSRWLLQNEARVFRERNPDVRILFWTSGNKERFKDVVSDPEKDLFLLTPPGFQGVPDVKPVVDRLKILPQRMTNPACGGEWRMEGTNGGGQEMTWYADTQGVYYYRLSPNYFMHSESTTVKFQGTGQGRLTVCFSRTIAQPIASQGGQGSQSGVTCRQLQGSDSTEFRVERPCDGQWFAIDCRPQYFSVVATDSTNRCQGRNTVDNGCRYPDLVRFTVTANGINCHSGASVVFISSFLIPTLALLLSKFS